MNLYYIHPYYEFSITDIDTTDFDISGFVLAFDPEQAVDLWCEGVHEMVEDVTIARDQKLGPNGPNPEDARTCIVVIDITFDVNGARAQFIPWDTLYKDYFTVKEA